MKYPWNLSYWQSGEWQVCNERLKDLEKLGIPYNPRRSQLFGSLRLLSPGESKVCIIGQDPYPNSRHATGIPFSIPGDIPREAFPPTLKTILDEYHSDLGYPIPDTGDLTRWVLRGVLLWNAIPTCTAGDSLSHDWEEYSWLTREIVGVLSEKGVVFVFMGGIARRYLEFVDVTKNEVIVTSHPSPRGNRNSKTPFEGSRLFSTVNDKLNNLGLDPIDWRLHVSAGEKDVPRTNLGGGVILPNSTGIELGGLKGSPKPNLHTGTFEL